MPVKLGVSCGGDLWSREDILAVEELGFDSYWTGEHIVYHRPIMEAVTLLSYVAGLTTRIKVGPATLLLPLRHAFIRMGASHAQRDIFHQYLLEAAIAGGRLALARALLSERTLAKPHSLGSWMRYATVLDQLGEPEAASAARQRGATINAAA